LSLSYAFKRVIRSWQLFIALLLSLLLASTFFAGVNIGADTTAKQALDQQLEQVLVDIVVRQGSGEPLMPLGSPAEEKLGLLSSEDATAIAGEISEIKDVKETEIISRAHLFTRLPDSNESTSFTLVGISDNSRVYEGWPGGASSLGENKTYVWINARDAGKLDVGAVLQFNLSIFAVPQTREPGDLTEPAEPIIIPFNLTVAGFVELDDRALSIAEGQYYQPRSPFFGPGLVTTTRTTIRDPNPNFLILDWEETFAALLDVIYSLAPSEEPLRTINTEILVYINREALISPWDIGTSITNLKTLTSQIQGKVLDYGLSASNRLERVLTMYQFMSLAMRFIFVITAIPVFFVAWYMGMTVSDVSFNLRRREIGLLLTKGFSRGQLLRIFLSEALLVGLIAGVAGLALSYMLSPVFVGIGGGQLEGTPVIGYGTVIVTVIFSVILTFLSVFQPARRASRLKAVDALREYMYVQEVKPYKKTIPWIAFLLGLYKMIILLLGVNVQVEVMRTAFRSGNILIMIFGAIGVFIDGILTYIGPLLFFWGLTKIFIRGSLKFQEFTAKAARFLGDLGELATRSVQRNPARAASTAFLIALIIGYTFQVVGSLASEQDFTIRQIHYTVGADISVPLSSEPLTNVTELTSKIDAVSGVSSSTVEYSFSVETGTGYINLRAVNPNEWLNIAYYESEWFTGSDAETAFQHLASDNDTIILERDVAKILDLKIDDPITVNFGKTTRNLRIVGFFAFESPEITIPGAPGVQFGMSRFWSYVSDALYETVSHETLITSAKILVKLENRADEKEVADRIRALDEPSIGEVYSVAEQLEKQQTSILYSGMLNIQRLGVIFAVLAASVGTALVTLVSLKERGKEATLMSVRGLSFRQLIVMLLTENLAIVTFAVLLGAVAGFIIVRGNVAASNAFAMSLVSRRVVFPPDALSTMLSSILLVFASTVIPVIVMARRYISKLERMVRLG
jgi:ABC-type antimicrobial peptide transport system permease subunit